MPPGRVLVLLSADERAVWGACENLDPAGNRRFRVTIFRNENRDVLSSELVGEATRRTLGFWRSHYGGVPCALTTEVDPSRTKRKRDPGRCFIKAGWRRLGKTKSGLIVLEAP